MFQTVIFFAYLNITGKVQVNVWVALIDGKATFPKKSSTGFYMIKDVVVVIIKNILY